MALLPNASKKYSTSPAGNFNFVVAIQDATEEVNLLLPVNAVRGLNDGTTNVVMHRANGFADTHLTPHAGLTTSDPVTLEGTCLYFMDDVKKLRTWRQQVTGDVDITEIGGQYKDVIIMPNKRNEKGATVDTENAAATIRLVNCLATKLTVSDFDENAPGFLTWSLEIRFERMEIE